MIQLDPRRALPASLVPPRETPRPPRREPTGVFDPEVARKVFAPLEEGAAKDPREKVGGLPEGLSPAGVVVGLPADRRRETVKSGIPAGRDRAEDPGGSS